MSVVIPVILCGGSGTRLWPLSRSDRPKQLISLFGDYTLLEGTLLRAKTIAGAMDPICVTAKAYGAEVRQSLDRLGLRGTLLLEPEPRNTAPALCAAALVAIRTDPKAVIVALPADHFIEDDEAFAASIARAVVAAEQGWLTILGVRPRHASTALGYIMPAAAIDGAPEVYQVSRFIEKPEHEHAESLIAAGALWNAGIVVARADAVKEAMRKHEPSVLEAVERSLAAGGSGADGLRLERVKFAGAPSISFDKAVLERHGDVALTPLDAAWRDVGTWAEVAELYPEDAEGNRYRGRAHFTSSRNSFVFSPHRLTVGIGLSDVVVVDSPDALLVANRKELGRLREVVEAVAADDYPEVIADKLEISPEARGEPGGTSAAIQATEISLNPGEVLLREPHSDAARYWIVVSGSVQATIGEEISTCEVNQSFKVRPGIAYRIASWGGPPVKLIEVQVAHGVAR